MSALPQTEQKAAFSGAFAPHLWQVRLAAFPDFDVLPFIFTYVLNYNLPSRRYQDHDTKLMIIRKIVFIAVIAIIRVEKPILRIFGALGFKNCERFSPTIYPVS